MWGEVRVGTRGVAAAQAACTGGARLKRWVCAERTENMPPMSLTLDVSKLSGWLNTLAYCRESKGGHTVQGKVRAGGREGLGLCGGASGMHTGRARLDAGSGHARSAR